MILLFLSDIHATLTKPRARLDNPKEVIERKFDYVFNWAAKQQDKVIVIGAGDLTETCRSWYTAQWLLQYFRKWYDGESPVIYEIFGQHDFYMRSRESKAATTLGILDTAKVVKALNGEGILIRDKCGRIVNLYGCNYGEEVQEPIIKRLKDEINILVIHKMILSKKLWKGQEKYEWAPTFLKKCKNYDFILCGDYHYKFLYHTKDGRTILNTGCMYRKTGSQLDMQHKPGFYVHNTNWEKGRVRWHPIPHEPAEKVMTRKHIEAKEEITEAMEKYVAKVVKASKKKKKGKKVKFEQVVVMTMDKMEVKQSVRDFTLNALRAGKGND